METSCGTVALMVLGQFSDICEPYGPRTIGATIPQLNGNQQNF